MRTIDLLRLSTRMFRTRPLRTWLTVLGISVGTGAVLFLVALGFGLQNIILQKIVFNKALLSLNITSSNQAIVLDTAALDKIRALPQVADVAPLARFTAQMRSHDLSGNVAILAVPPSYFDYAGVSPVHGTLFTDADRGKVVVSAAVLRMFGFSDPLRAIGQTMELQLYVLKDPADASSLSVVDLPTTYAIGGIIDEAQDSYVYVPIGDIAAVTTVNQFNQTQAQVHKGDELEAAKDAVIDMGFQVSSLSEVVDQANKIFSVIQWVLGVFGAFALAVSSIGMFNTMTVTLLERTNEIGVMRAIGASRRNIQLMFLTEAVLIGFLGGIVGVVIGFVGGRIFNLGINLLAARLGGAPIDLFSYPTQFMVVIVGISTVIGLLSGVFPSRRAAALDPLEALRYK